MKNWVVVHTVTLSIKLSDEQRSRFMSRINKSGPVIEPLRSPCWTWTAGINGGGYGTFQFQRLPWVAHRIMWILTHGKIPRNKYVLHQCDNRRCVNPDHLFLGTHYDNMRDKCIKKRCPGQRNTHCKRGHEFTPENTIPNSGGRGRQCKQCARMHSRNFHRKLANRLC